MSDSSEQRAAVEEYRLRREAFARRLADCTCLDGRIALLRGVLFLTGLALFVSNRMFERPSLGWIWLPTAGFTIAALWHAAVLGRRQMAALGVGWHQASLDRLAGRWAGLGRPGDRYRDARHPYSDDLDLFGVGSLFELLCRCGTRLGEDSLAQWLLRSASRETILERQEAHRELLSNFDLREQAGLIAAASGDGNQNLLHAWAGAPARPLSLPTRIGVVSLGVAFWITVFGWLADVMPGSIPLVLLVACLAWMHYLRPVLLETVHGIDQADAGLLPLVGLLRLIEQQQFTSSLLVRLQSRVNNSTRPASAEIDRLRQIGHGLDGVLRNQFLAPIAATTGLPVWLHAKAQAWRSQNGGHVPEWLDAVGEFETVLSFSAYAAEHPSDCWPLLLGDGPHFEARQLGHPLLPEAKCIRNNVFFGDPVRLLLVSGSNMAGKSTLLRAVGTAVVLANCGAPVRAAALSLSPLSLGSVIRTGDSLRDGRSLFFAALERLKQVVLLADKSPPAMFLLDELLAGTNSHDRRIGAEAVIRRLIEANAIGLVTTHDLALTEIADDLGDLGVNMHFRDVLVGGTLQFDHQLRPGIVDRGNALTLMRGLGLLRDEVPIPAG